VRTRKETAGVLPWVSVLAMPVVTVVVGLGVTKAIADREVNARYVELAISILRDQPNKETTAIRQWAVEIVNKYAAVKLTPEARSELDKFSFPRLSEKDVQLLKLVTEKLKGLNADGAVKPEVKP
jgi:hypothetical protein